MKLTIENIVSHILVESGQFVGGVEATLLDQPSIKLMCDRVLATWGRHFPTERTSGARLYNNKSFSIQNDGFVPHMITEIRRRYAPALLFGGIRQFGTVSDFYWKYMKPQLYFNLPDDTYEVKFTEIPYFDDNNELILPDNDPAVDKLLSLMTAQFMISVGRSRRAFTIDEIPIRTDADAMINEGKALQDATLEEIRKTNKWHLAIIP